MKVTIISASLRKNGNIRIAMNYVFENVKSKNVEVKILNLSEEQIECYIGTEEEYNYTTKNSANDAMDADVWLIGSPIYNFFFSSELKKESIKEFEILSSIF